MSSETVIGIDVSRDWLDGFCLPENRLATAREQRQKQGEAGPDLERIGHQDVMQTGGFEAAAQMVIDR
ncbi:MAG: IS110 family transposase [Gluconobacter cerinus]|uniref:IS110 family transposase n=1 Tax=Gluconobacter cerinus TaxID=38307 RepID=UPI0039ED747A